MYRSLNLYQDNSLFVKEIGIEAWAGGMGREIGPNLRLTSGRLARRQNAAGPGRPDAAAPAGEPVSGPEPRPWRGDPE